MLTMHGCCMKIFSNVLFSYFSFEGLQLFCSLRKFNAGPFKNSLDKVKDVWRSSQKQCASIEVSRVRITTSFPRQKKRKRPPLI